MVLWIVGVTNDSIVFNSNYKFFAGVKLRRNLNSGADWLAKQ